MGGTGAGFERGSFCLFALLFNGREAGQRAGLEPGAKFHGQEIPLPETRYRNSEPGGLAGG